MLEDLGNKAKRNHEEDNSHIELLKEGVAAQSRQTIDSRIESPQELILNSRYRFLEKKQRNPYSGRTAYLALDMQTGQEVYLKEYGFPRVRDEDYDSVERQFKAEVEISNILGGIDGSCVPRVLDTFEDGYLRYIVFEKKEGTSVRTAVSEKWGYTEKDVAGVALQALDQLKVLHERRMTNRDIKPDHLLVDESYRLTGLLDFSAAADREYSTTTLTRGVYSGFFSAPEAITGNKPDFRCDYYSLGAVMFFMLTKKVPDETTWIYKPSKRFVRKELKRAHVSSDMSELVVKLLSGRADDRHCAYEVLRADLVKVYGKEKVGEERRDAERSVEQTLETAVENTPQAEQVTEGLAERVTASEDVSGSLGDETNPSDDFCGWKYLLQQSPVSRALNVVGTNSQLRELYLVLGSIALEGPAIGYASYSMILKPLIEMTPGEFPPYVVPWSFAMMAAFIGGTLGSTWILNRSLDFVQKKWDSIISGYEELKKTAIGMYERGECREVRNYLNRNKKQRGALYLEVINQALLNGRLSDAVNLRKDMDDFCSRKERKAADKLMWKYPKGYVRDEDCQWKYSDGRMERTVDLTKVIDNVARYTITRCTPGGPDFDTRQYMRHWINEDRNKSLLSWRERRAIKKAPAMAEQRFLEDYRHECEKGQLFDYRILDSIKRSNPDNIVGLNLSDAEKGLTAIGMYSLALQYKRSESSRIVGFIRENAPRFLNAVIQMEQQYRYNEAHKDDANKFRPDEFAKKVHAIGRVHDAQEKEVKKEEGKTLEEKVSDNPNSDDDFCGWKYLMRVKGEESGQPLFNGIKVLPLFLLSAAGIGYMASYVLNKNPNGDIHFLLPLIFVASTSLGSQLISEIREGLNDGKRKDYQSGYEKRKKKVIDLHEKGELGQYAMSYFCQRKEDEAPLYLELMHHCLVREDVDAALRIQAEMGRNCTKKEYKAARRLMKEYGEEHPAWKGVTLEGIAQDEREGKVKMYGKTLIRYQQEFCEERWGFQYYKVGRKPRLWDDVIPSAMLFGVADSMPFFVYWSFMDTARYFPGAFPVAVKALSWLTAAGGAIPLIKNIREYIPMKRYYNDRKKVADGLREAYAESGARAVKFLDDFTNNIGRHGKNNPQDAQMIALELLNAGLCRSDHDVAKAAIDKIAELEMRTQISAKDDIDLMLHNFDHRGIWSDVLMKMFDVRSGKVKH